MLQQVERFVRRSKEFEVAESVTTYLSARVARELFLEVLAHPGLETGGMLLGALIEDGNNHKHVIPAGSITPPMTDSIRRTAGSFTVGSPLLVEYYNWVDAQWQYLLEAHFERIGLNPDLAQDHPLHLLGYWHKHPGTYIMPSSIDHSAFANILKSYDQFLVPIVCHQKRRSNGSFAPKAHSQAIRITQTDHPDDAVDVLFYYITRDAIHTRNPYALTEIKLAKKDKVLNIPQIPWHIAERTKVLEELALLKKLGVELSFRPVINVEAGRSDSYFEISLTVHSTVVRLKIANDFASSQTFLLTVESETSSPQTLGLKKEIGKSLAESIFPIINYLKGKS